MSKLSDKKEFTIINDLNKSRGPNAEGYWTNSTNCQLGFRRLSILDLTEKGNQPMISFHKNYSMVFNGEIYNYQLLKNELLSQGYSFKSTGDAEVLVNYFECFGIHRTLKKIDGMFAIALFDIAQSKLYLIRDFAGIKPLFYGVNQSDVVFGSRYDQISKHPAIKKDIDARALKLYLQMHYVPAPFGILKSTFQVEPGQVVTITKSNIEKSYYWTFPDLKKEDLITDKEQAIDLLSRELEKSVKNQLIADVPLGTFLSGGIDSPLITFLAKKNKRDITAFTIGSDSKIHDESDVAKIYADKIGCQLVLKKMNSKDAEKILKRCMENLQEPFADFSLIPTFELTKNASKDFTVMLSGDGGDELFFGYERFYSVSKNFMWRFIPSKLRYFFYGIDKVFTKNAIVNEGFLEKNLAQAHQGLHSRFSDNDIDNIFPELRQIDSYKLPYYNYSEETDKLTFLHQMRKAEFYGMMQKTLIKVDRMSMANSLEVRVPFLQKNVIEAAVKIHPNLSFQKQQKKIILKDLLREYINNPPINNIKKGFSVPLTMWLREELREVVYQSLFDNHFITAFSINKDYLQSIWEKHQAGEKDYKWLIFTVYSLQQWYQNIIK